MYFYIIVYYQYLQKLQCVVSCMLFVLAYVCWGMYGQVEMLQILMQKISGANSGWT